MTLIIVKNGPPACPLCGNTMREIVTRKATFYVCVQEMCMISVNKNDPCIKTWETIEKPICQFCGKPMKIFVRKDKFCIMQCRDSSHAPYQIARGDARGMPPLEDTHG